MQLSDNIKKAINKNISVWLKHAAGGGIEGKLLSISDSGELIIETKGEKGKSQAICNINGVVAFFILEEENK